MWRTGLLLVVLFLFTACVAPTPAPLGPESFVFRGDTIDRNPYGGLNDPNVSATSGSLSTFGTIDALTIMVTPNDFPYTGTAGQLQIYRNARYNSYHAPVNSYWKQASFNNLDIAFDWKSEVFPMPKAFDDYFYRLFKKTKLVTLGLKQFSWPLTLDGTATVTLHIRDAANRDVEVVLAPSGTFADNSALAVYVQGVFDAVPEVPNDWVIVTPLTFEVIVELDELHIKEGTFIRVKSISGPINAFGYASPIEKPGSDDSTEQASLRGRPIPGGSQVFFSATSAATIEVRDKNLVTRRYDVQIPAGTSTSLTALTNHFVNECNTEFHWIESWFAGSDRIGLRIKPAFSGRNAAVRVVDGTELQAFGLHGARRTDGTVHPDAESAIKGNRQEILGVALSLYMKKRLQESGPAITEANKNGLDNFVEQILDDFDCVWVLFVDELTGIPSGRRAAASSDAHFNLRIDGVGDYVYVKQVQIGSMIGPGDRDWQTWAHELGHVMGFPDLYWKSTHEGQFDRDFDYVNEWGLMDEHLPAPHVVGYLKHLAGWMNFLTVADVDQPPGQAFVTSRFTLIPNEYSISSYSGVGTATYPAAHLVRLKLSDDHWIYLENRQTGPSYSAALPDENGKYPPITSTRGGLLITDTCDHFKPCIYRSPVTVLNPHGTRVAKGLFDGDWHDLGDQSVYPRYDGNRIEVVGTVPGPLGRPDALRVDIKRGPGDFVDLEIRPWNAPEVYATFDIWIDWEGNGVEDYPGGVPFIGSGDHAHWHPDGKVVNIVKVRVHNKGNIEATGVQVKCLANEVGMGAKGKFTEIGNSPSAAQNIPAQGFRDFHFEWRLTGKGHNCIRAEVLTHTSNAGEYDLDNNYAQENINDFFPVAGSPYPPYDFDLVVNSDFAEPIEVMLLPTGLQPGWDLELERREFLLGPNEEQRIKARLFVDPALFPPDRRKAYWFNLHAFRFTGESWVPFGGITCNVKPSSPSSLELTGRIVRKRKPGGEMGMFLHGRLKGAHRNNQPVDAAVIGSDGIVYQSTATTNSAGVFLMPLDGVPAGVANVMLYYFGPGMGPSHLGPVDVTIPP